MTRDCPTGLRAYRKRAGRYAAATFAAVLGLFSATAFSQKVYGRSDAGSGVRIERGKSTSKLGEVTGTVLDSSGAVIPGVPVALAQVGGKPLLIITDSDGAFIIKDVSPAPNYYLNVGAEKMHFTPLTVQNLDVRGGERMSITVSLSLGEGTVTVGIFGEEPMINIGSSAVETRITRRKLESIPHK